MPRASLNPRPSTIAPRDTPKAESLSDLTERLRQRARRVTAPRQAILERLRHQDHPLSCREVFGGLPRGSCDLATVYRSLRLLEGLQLVKRFDLGDGLARFELIRPGDTGHHHHLVCTGCAQVVELDECFPTELERRIAARNGYKAITHKLEFFGLCPECQTPTASAGRLDAPPSAARRRER
jgi:Fur family ferric uptake transcriptional regulator